MTGTPNTNGEQTGQPNATVTPGQGNEEINGASKPGEVSPKPEENNPTATEPGTTAPGNTNQDTQVKPNTDQTATGTPAGTDNQNTQQGNTEQNNQNAQPSAPGTTAVSYTHLTLPTKRIV